MDLLSKYTSTPTDVTSGQTSALSNLSGATSNLPDFSGSGSTALTNLFGSSTTPQVGMLQSALSGLQGNIGGTASGADLNPYSTPGFSDALKTMTNDITNSVKGVYAGSGRDPSGAGSFAQSLGRGLTQGEAPTIAAQYNQNKANQMNAANSLFSGTGTTAGQITGQQQVPLANQTQALGLIPQLMQAFTAPAQTQLGAANTAYSQPFANLSALLGPLTSIAGLGQSSTGSGTSTTTQPQSTAGNILGGLAGGAGILSSLGGSAGVAGLLPLLAAI
jgi:hypothetical protein